MRKSQEGQWIGSNIELNIVSNPTQKKINQLIKLLEAAKQLMQKWQTEMQPGSSSYKAFKKDISTVEELITHLRGSEGDLTGKIKKGEEFISLFLNNTFINARISQDIDRNIEQLHAGLQRIKSREKLYRKGIGLFAISLGFFIIIAALAVQALIFANTWSGNFVNALTQYVKTPIFAYQLLATVLLIGCVALITLGAFIVISRQSEQKADKLYAALNPELKQIVSLRHAQETIISQENVVDDDIVISVPVATQNMKNQQNNPENQAASNNEGDKVTYELKLDKDGNIQSPERIPNPNSSVKTSTPEESDDDADDDSDDDTPTGGTITPGNV